MNNYPISDFIVPDPNTRTEPPNWFHESLINASRWLKQNNPIFKRYDNNRAMTRSSPSDPFPEPLPTARLVSRSVDRLPSNQYTAQPPSLVVPNDDFPARIHDEDYRYERLMAGFMDLDDDLVLPIQLSNPDVEALVFPDLFPTGRGHYEDVKKLLSFKQVTDSYGKKKTELPKSEQNFESEECLISDNAIRADMPHPVLEPELHWLVTTFQIHRCIAEKCRGPGTNLQPCKNGFPQPLSNDTYCRPNSKRYVYRRTKEEDRWVVPYHPETLLIWQGHINFQYITTLGFGKYVTKYATKPEPTEIFNVSEQDSYSRHVQARRLGSMELMILLLQYSITRSSASVQYLPSAPSELRIRSVKPVHMQIEEQQDDDEDEDEEKPYFDDAIDKYFDRPSNELFENLTYPEYFQRFKVGGRPPGRTCKLYLTRDLKNRFVAERTKPLLVRFTNYNVDDGEPFFYQHLIMKHAVRSEVDLLGGFTSYRDRFRSLYPIRYEQAVLRLSKSSVAGKFQLSEAFKRVIEHVLTDLQKNDLWDVIYNQLISLEKPSLRTASTLMLDHDQYKIYNTLCNSWGPECENKYPYFFMTGSAVPVKYQTK
nr:1436_t:CDS:2 [Entrophospora candida]